MTPRATPRSGEEATLPRLLRAQGARLGGAVAIREKRYGIWQEVSWAEYAAHVRALALGLARLGAARGDKVAVLSGNRPAWLYAGLAVQAVGAGPLGLFGGALPDHAGLRPR